MVPHYRLLLPETTVGMQRASRFLLMSVEVRSGTSVHCALYASQNHCRSRCTSTWFTHHVVYSFGFPMDLLGAIPSLPVVMINDATAKQRHRRRDQFSSLKKLPKCFLDTYFAWLVCVIRATIITTTWLVSSLGRCGDWSPTASQRALQCARSNNPLGYRCRCDRCAKGGFCQSKPTEFKLVTVRGRVCDLDLEVTLPMLLLAAIMLQSTTTTTDCFNIEGGLLHLVVAGSSSSAAAFVREGRLPNQLCLLDPIHT